ncbi:MAG: ATP-binding cassette domain-containing protein [Bacteroides sp.]|nr:ATP-binding cassette domain-containing protein [Eubacterium sp.]MCM1417363.1 ATP-binding cassette domain-containing protein [Roseburia sp.]MCM1461445.1 ATP-binding cassette domain-containing protein [Bacteroides sp.]
MTLSANKIGKSFGEKPVLADFSHTFADGSFTSVMGASGSGKTTLLMILMGLIAPDEGRVEPAPSGFKKSAVFQENRLCENLTVLANLRLLPERPSNETVRAALARLGLSDAEYAAVKTLSGGMKRRVALLRALLAEYEVLFLDEPFKGLDEETKRRAMDYTRETTVGKTVILVTHDPGEAEFFGGGIIRL